MEFQFVTHGDAQQPGTRKAIRSHVMKGKNAGRKLPPRQKRKRRTTGATEHDGTPYATEVTGRRKPAAGHNVDSGSGLRDIAGGQRETQRIASARSPARIPGVVGHELSWWPFPDEFSSQSVDLLRYFYFSRACNSRIPPFCKPKDTVGSFFWQFSIADEAFLHVMCAMLGVLCENSLPTRTAPRLILSHVSRGLHLVNKQIESASYPSASSPTSGSTAIPISDAAPPTLPNHTESAVSDTTIASILLLSIYERLRGDYDRADVHLRGLKRIADLRGGISTLYTTKGLASKICRADIDLALHFGRKTVFSATETRAAMSIQSGGCGSSGGQLNFLLGDGKAKASQVAAVEERPEEHGIVAQLSPKYAELMRDLLRMARFLNSTAGVPVLDVYGCEALLVNLCYRVVELRPLRHCNAIAATSRSTTPRITARGGRDIPLPATDNMQGSAIPSLSPAPTSSHSQPPPPSSLVSNIDDAAHLGAAAFTTTLLLEFSQQLVTHELLRTSLRTSIQRLVSSGVQNLRAALWLCFVGGVSVFKLALNTILAKPTTAAATATPAVADDDDATWLLPQIHELCQDLCLENWSDVLLLLGGEFPWVHSLHDGPAKALWDATVAMATSSGRTGSSASVEPTQTSLIWNSLSGMPCEKIRSEDRPQPPPFKLKPLQTLSHEPGVTLSHPQYGVW